MAHIIHTLTRSFSLGQVYFSISESGGELTLTDGRCGTMPPPHICLNLCHEKIGPDRPTLGMAGTWCGRTSSRTTRPRRSAASAPSPATSSVRFAERLWYSLCSNCRLPSSLMAPITSSLSPFTGDVDGAFFWSEKLQFGTPKLLLTAR